MRGELIGKDLNFFVSVESKTLVVISTTYLDQKNSVKTHGVDAAAYPCLSKF